MQRVDLFSHIIDNLNDGVYFVDLDRQLRLWNKGAEVITGFTSEEMLGKRCQETLLQHIDEFGHPLCTTGCPLYSTIIDGQQRKARVLVRHKLGHRIPIFVNIFPIYENDTIIGAVEIFTRDSPTVYEDDLIAHLSEVAMHDALTALPNRRYLESFLEYRLGEFKRFDKPLAVLFADIDNFSAFNNEYGHDAGDAVLKNIAASLRISARSNDLVGRWGGEEFLGIYQMAKPDDAPIIAEKFRLLVEATVVEHAGNSLHVTVSVGVTVAQASDTPESIVERADKMMYSGKAAGKNTVVAD